MSDRGPISEYEVVWKNGHVERVKAHQVSEVGHGPFERDRAHRIYFHGEVDGRWQLILAVLADDISTVRNLTQTEFITGDNK